MWAVKGFALSEILGKPDQTVLDAARLNGRPRLNFANSSFTTWVCFIGVWFFTTAGIFKVVLSADPIF